jgi:hypothetical protein
MFVSPPDLDGLAQKPTAQDCSREYSLKNPRARNVDGSLPMDMSSQFADGTIGEELHAITPNHALPLTRLGDNVTIRGRGTGKSP